MSRGGGLVFTGMPRRREVLGTGIIRWAKVVNPDGTVTWQEAQPTASLDSKKEEKKTEKKQTLERPSWIDVKKESSNVRISGKRRATDAEELKAEEQKVEARPTRAFGFRTEEKETKRTENATNSVEQVRFAAPIHVRNDEKKGLVAGLATKFGSTSSKAEAFSLLPKKEKVKVEMQQPARPLIKRRNAEDLHSDKLKLKLTRDEPKAHSPPQTEEDKNPPVANDFPSHYWSTQQEPKHQESDAELAQRLANTEKIFRQQEQKIQAALDRIRDLERQLATGFSSSSTSEQDDVQSKTSSEDDSIAAGGREAGPYFRHASSISSMSAPKGPPLPFSDQDDEPRVLTVNSHKPQLCAVDDDQVNQHHRHELEGSTGVISDMNSRRTPSPPRAVDIIPQYEEQPKSPQAPAPAAHLHMQQQQQQQQLHLHPIVNAPHSHTYHTLKVKVRIANTPTTTPVSANPNPKPTTSSTKSTSTPTATKHKPLPSLPIDAIDAIRPPLHAAATPSLCVRPPRPPPRAMCTSSFKKQQEKGKVRPLTPIPEEPCSLKRRPRVVRTRRMSRSSTTCSIRRVSTAGELCSVGGGSCSGGGRPVTGSGTGLSGRSGSHCSVEGREGGLRRRSFERCRTN